MSKIKTSSTAEYFSKNLQQVGFSSPLKAVLTTLKEAVDNSLDACEEDGILPHIKVQISKIGKGSSRNTDLVKIVIEDNGPGLSAQDLPAVFGEYLASSKFGKGQCSRGQQGIGISAATTWAQLTNATGVYVESKTKKMPQALSMVIDVDIKNNKGLVKKKTNVKWTSKKHGLKAAFIIDGKVQLNGDGGLITYLEGTALVNPHLEMHYTLLDNDPVHVKRVSDIIPRVPPPTLPHPHTMKLGEFITYSHLYGKMSTSKFLKTGFSRVSDATVKELFKKGKIKSSLMNLPLPKLSDADFKKIFESLQETPLMNPQTNSVLIIGEEALAQSIHRIGDVDFFSVVTRKPRICDFKPVVIEVAMARLSDVKGKEEASLQLLRFANRVPLQFDKSSCALTKAVESVNWKAYGLQQSKNSVPGGPYVLAISMTSPFIKFKNASKETIDASDELVEEIRKALIQTGQKLGRYIRKEKKEFDLERKIQHIEKFAPILVGGLVKITKAPASRKKKAELGLMKILGRDAKSAEAELTQAKEKLK
ncbi:MAG: DNA topoisomerase VI subunit B [Bdellovibrionaceae bacterium]|nr:DNA topoisomerase VI subunit B [Pseudobdellovibrionaceae bacterium]